MEKRRKLGQRVLAEGEHTGHAHRVSVDVYEGEAPGTREFTGTTILTHEEHQPITLPEGSWCSGVVQEFDHVAQHLRAVQD